MNRQAAAPTYEHSRAASRFATAVLQRKCECGTHTIAGGECDACAEEKRMLQRRADAGHEPSEVPPIVHEVLRSPGQPLDAATRAFFEPRFGHDFSQVRVHADQPAARSAAAVAARAYTVGSDVVFGAGRYAPATREGQRLLAHELTHVVQQEGAAAATPLSIQSANEPEERAAASAADRLAQDRPFSPNVGVGSAVLQRDEAGPSSSAGPPGVPAEKWSELSENTYRRAGEGYKAHAIRSCRLYGAEWCLMILTEQEARAAYELAKEGYEAHEAASRITRSQQSVQKLARETVATTAGEVLPRLAPWIATAAWEVGKVVVRRIPLVALAAVFAASLAEEFRIGKFINLLEGLGFVVLINPLGACIWGCHAAPTARAVPRDIPWPEPIALGKGGRPFELTPWVPPQAPPRAPVRPRIEPTTKTAPAPRPRPKPKPETKPTTDVFPVPQTPTEPDKERRRRRKCNDEPCGVLPILWPRELPPPSEQREFKRTKKSEREAEGIDRGPDQRAFADCLREARREGKDLQTECGDLGGEWYDPDLLPSEPVDAHHTHPLYLGGEDAPYNLAAIEFNRHRLGHKALNNQIVMFETDPTWINCRVCSPLLTRHPINQEYEPIVEES